MSRFETHAEGVRAVAEHLARKGYESKPDHKNMGLAHLDVKHSFRGVRFKVRVRAQRIDAAWWVRREQPVDRDLFFVLVYLRANAEPSYFIMSHSIMDQLMLEYLLEHPKGGGITRAQAQPFADNWCVLPR